MNFGVGLKSMDYSASDPAPISFAPPSNMTSTPPFSFSQPGANLPTHTEPRALNHPSYEEMIIRAIMALNEKEGSSRQRIARYIENEFHVPQSSSHSSELTQQLRKMKIFGQLVLVRHSYMLPNPGPPQPQPLPSIGPYAVQPSVGPYVQPSAAPYPISDGHKRPGRPPKLQPIVGTTVASPSPTPTPSPSLPVGFAAFSPKQLGVPTTNLFGGLTPAASAYQFGAGSISNVSTVSPAAGPVNNASTMPSVSGPLNRVPTMTLASGPLNRVPTMTLACRPVTNVTSTGPVSGSMSNVLITGPVSEPLNNVPAMGGLVSNALLTSPVSGPMNNVPAISLFGERSSEHVSQVGPVFNPAALAKVGPSEQIDESVVVESKVDSVMVGTGPESSAGPIVVSATKDPTIAQNNDGPLLVVSAGPDSVAQNNDGPSTMLGKRGRGRPPKINGGLKKVVGKPAIYVQKKGRRGRPKQVAISTMSLRPRGRPRKNAVSAIVAVDRANGGGGGVFPVAKIPWEPRGNSLGLPNKDVPDTASLTSEIYLMAYHGLKARVEHYQTEIKSVVSVVKPYLNETAVIALGALQDLEDLANMDVLSVPINGQTAVNVQDAPGDDLNAPVNIKDVATKNIQSLPSTGEDAQLTFQGRQSDAETAQLTFLSATVPVQGQQEPPLQS